ncbi:MAG: hypothetical protein RBR07_04925 [Arcobacteraceae bacterium]|nr:hypothetical protein [Arcobacteraceae bacterium]
MGDFEKLKSMKIDEIYNKTYVAHNNIEAIVNKEFNKLNRFKTFGFINIIEKKFGFDLSDLKAEADVYFKSIEKDKVVVVKEENIIKDFNKKWIILGVAALILFLVLIFQGDSEETDTKVQEVAVEQELKQEVQEDKILEEFIEDETYLITPKDEVQEAIVSQEQLPVEVKEEVVPQEKIKEVVVTKKEVKEIALPKITIAPKQQIWVGVIYLDNHLKKDYLTSNNIPLDTTKEHLIVTGHGHLVINTDGVETDYSSNDKLRFLYKDNELKLINMEIFKELNNGKSW